MDEQTKAKRAHPLEGAAFILALILPFCLSIAALVYGYVSSLLGWVGLTTLFYGLAFGFVALVFHSGPGRLKAVLGTVAVVAVISLGLCLPAIMGTRKVPGQIAEARPSSLGIAAYETGTKQQPVSSLRKATEADIKPGVHVWQAMNGDTGANYNGTVVETYSSSEDKTGFSYTRFDRMGELRNPWSDEKCAYAWYVMP